MVSFLCSLFFSISPYIRYVLGIGSYALCCCLRLTTTHQRTFGMLSYALQRSLRCHYRAIVTYRLRYVLIVFHVS